MLVDRSGYAYLSLGWFVLGLTTLLLGIPAGILGYKRFPRNIWVRVARGLRAHVLMRRMGDGRACMSA
jgi:hypothetical protein